MSLVNDFNSFVTSSILPAIIDYYRTVKGATATVEELSNALLGTTVSGCQVRIKATNQPCGRPMIEGQTVCGRHKPKNPTVKAVDPNAQLCATILTSTDRKGQVCGREVAEGCTVCRFHKPKNKKTPPAAVQNNTIPVPYLPTTSSTLPGLTTMNPPLKFPTIPVSH